MLGICTHAQTGALLALRHDPGELASRLLRVSAIAGEVAQASNMSRTLRGYYTQYVIPSELVIKGLCGKLVNDRK